MINSILLDEMPAVSVAASPVHIQSATRSSDAQQWNHYVERHSQATPAHWWEWREIAEKVFKAKCFYLCATRGKELAGVLPLAWQRSPMFGSLITSMPFLNAGGALADTPEIERQLVEHAIQLTREVNARRLELRYRDECRLSLPSRTHKVAAVRDLDPDVDGMWKSLDSNNRRKVNKAVKSGMTAGVEPASSVPEFYRLFTSNMHNLGTPAYPIHLFTRVFEAFGDRARLIMVRLNGRAIAGSITVRMRGTAEAIWICSDWDYLKLQPNMLLYWTILKVSAEENCRAVDFGRSTRGSGTHTFKKLWDTRDVDLHWAYWTASAEGNATAGQESRIFRLASKIWTKLPLSVANQLGPRISIYLS